MTEALVNILLVCDTLWSKVVGTIKDALLYTGIVTWICIVLLLIGEARGG